MKYRLASLLLVLSLAISPATWAGPKADSSAADRVVELPLGKAAPLPGALAVSADGRIAAHIGANGDIVIWDASQVKPLETISSGDKKPSAVALGADGNLVAIGYLDSRLVIRSRLEKKPLREFYGHSGAIYALVFSPDGQLLASGGDDATTQLWQVATGKRLQVFDSKYNGDISTGSGIPVSIAFASNGKVLLVNEWYSRHYDVGRATTLWDIEQGIEISTRDVAPPNSDSTMRAGHALGGTGWLLAYTGGWISEQSGLMVERLDQCESPRQLPSGGYADTVAADPLGRWVAATGDDKVTFLGIAGDEQTYATALPARAIALVPHPDGRNVFALLLADTRPTGNDHFIVSRDAEAVAGGALYRIPVPTPLWRLPTLSTKENAVHCAATVASRLQQDYSVPEIPPKLEITAKLMPPGQMTAGVSPFGGKIHSGYPRELYFNKTGSLFVFYQGAFVTEAFARSGAVEWNATAQVPIRARFEDRVDRDLVIRMRDGWATAADRIVNILTGKPFSNISKVDNEAFYLHASVTVDPDTGAVFRAREGYFEAYASDGRRLKDVEAAGAVEAFTARNGKLAALYLNGNVQVWPFDPMGETKVFKLLESERNADGSAGNLALSGDGRYLRVAFSNASGDGPDDYLVFDLSSAKSVGDGALLANFPGRANRGVVADARQNRIAVWDYDKKEIIARLPRHRSRDKSGAVQPLQVAISDDGRLVASASYDGLVRIWDIDAHQMRGEGRTGGETTAIAFDSQGQRLAAGRRDAQIVVFQVPAPK